MSARWLNVGDNLRMTCFVKRKATGGLEVTVAVREWDDIITSQPVSHPRFVINRSTQQHRRASIRQAMLDLKLRNRNADQGELQLLKQRGVLGTRAPSGTLIHAEDMRHLLIGFGHTVYAERLRQALESLRKHEGVEDDGDHEMEDAAPLQHLPSDNDQLMIDVPMVKVAAAAHNVGSANGDSPPVSALNAAAARRPNRVRKPSSRANTDASQQNDQRNGPSIKRTYSSKTAQLEKERLFILSDSDDSPSDSDMTITTDSDSDNEHRSRRSSKRYKLKDSGTKTSSNASPQSGAVFLDMLLEAISYLPGDELVARSLVEPPHP